MSEFQFQLQGAGVIGSRTYQLPPHSIREAAALLSLPEWLCLALSLLIVWLLKRSKRSNLDIFRAFSIIPRNPLLQVAIIFALSICGRLAGLGTEHIPHPAVHDEFAYLLGADTFAHGRLTNPTPEFWTHFETYHELLRPTYMSKYPPGQSLFLALGQVLFNQPFAGVMLSCALMCVAVYWALTALAPRRWAFLSGVLAAIRIGWYSGYDNDYWGGAVTALAGCLLIGSAVRLSRKVTPVQAGIFAFSLILLANSRPYEGVLLALPVVIGLGIKLAKIPHKITLVPAILSFALIFMAGAGWMTYYNWRLTGHALELPYSEHNRQYAMPPAFLLQRLPPQGNEIKNDQKNQYLAVGLPDYLEGRTIKGFILISLIRATKIWSFYVGPSLSLLIVGAILIWRNKKFRWMLFLLVFMILGWEPETWAQTHYYAAATPVFFALEIFSFRALYTWRRRQQVGKALVAAIMLSICVSAFARLLTDPIRSILGKPTRLHTDPSWVQSKLATSSVLQSIPGNHLVLVRYPPGHDPHDEWVYNGYDIPSQRIIWAHDLDPSDPNLPLICHYKDRHVWKLEPSDSEAWDTRDARQALKAVDVEQLCNAGQVAAR